MTNTELLAQRAAALIRKAGGLFISLEWASERASRTPDREGVVEVVNRLKDKGFLVSNAGHSTISSRFDRRWYFNRSTPICFSAPSKKL